MSTIPPLSASTAGPQNSRTVKPVAVRPNQPAQTALQEAAKLDAVKNAPDAFSLFKAGTSFFKGILKPVTNIISHPVKTLATALAVTALTVAVPALLPIILVAGAGLAVYHIGRGVKNAVTQYHKGNYRAAEAAFEDIGLGTVEGVLLSLGVRKSAQNAAKASAMGENASVAKVAASVKTAGNGSFGNAIKSQIQALLTPNYWKGVGMQLKPLLFWVEKNQSLAKSGMTFLASLWNVPSGTAATAIAQIFGNIGKIAQVLPQYQPRLMYDFSAQAGAAQRQKKHPQGFIAPVIIPVAQPDPKRPN